MQNLVKWGLAYIINVTRCYQHSTCVHNRVEDIFKSITYLSITARSTGVFLLIDLVICTPLVLTPKITSVMVSCVLFVWWCPKRFSSTGDLKSHQLVQWKIFKE